MRFYLKTGKWKKEIKDGWYHWFAWYPVSLCNAVNVNPKTGEQREVWIWLEWIMRKDEYGTHPDNPDETSIFKADAPNTFN